MHTSSHDFKVFFGSSNNSFNRVLRNYLKQRNLGKATVSKFSDGEISIEIHDNIENLDVYVVQSTCHPVNDNLIELLLIADALKRSSVSSLTAIVPYFGYARQDRRIGTNTPISAKMVANIFMTSGIDRLITMDLHSNQISGFFDIPVIHLSFSPLVYSYIRKNFDTKNITIVAPDAGRFSQAIELSNKLGCEVAFINKSRPSHNTALASSLVGSVNKKSVIIQDDMIDTAGTLMEAVKIISKFNPDSITVFCTHPVLSGTSLKKIANSSIKTLIVSDSIPVSKIFLDTQKVKILSVAEIFAKSIKKNRIQTTTYDM